jgi:hypothetical protein
MGRLNIFNDIKTAVEAVSGIQTVRLYNSQFENESEELAFNYPAVFIEIAEIEYENKTRSLQDANYTFVLHCGFVSYDTEDTTVLTTIDNIHKAVHGLDGQDYTPLILVRAEHDSDHANVIIERLTFECREHIEIANDTNGYTAIGSAPSLNLSTDLDIDDEVIRSGDGVI